MSEATKGDKVKIHYTGVLADGKVFDSSEGHDPLEFEIGSGQVIPGFEEAVLGMKVGEAINVTIPVDKAYGPRKDEMVLTVPKERVPEDLNPEVGQMMQMGGPKGQVIAAKVIEVTEKHVKLDANPPLAGKDLTFDIELVAIG